MAGIYKQFSGICEENYDNNYYGNEPLLNINSSLSSVSHKVIENNGTLTTTDPQCSISLGAHYTYYLKFTVVNQSTEQLNINLKLVSTNDAANGTGQTIQKIKFNNNTQTYELLFTTYDEFSAIRWEQVINLEDLINENIPSYSVNNVILYELVKKLPEENNNKIITKIGIQAPASTLIAINGQPIRIGRNGIFELIESINITSVHIAPKAGDIFLIDYRQE